MRQDYRSRMLYFKKMQSKTACLQLAILVIINTIQFANQQENMVNIENEVPSINTTASFEVHQHDKRRRCPKPNYRDCLKQAKSLTSNNNVDDIKFFQQCIVDYYCFKKSPTSDEWISLPDYTKQFSDYFNYAAKRIERFFIRNNDWSLILEAKQLRNGNTCQNLLYVIAARYHYVVYVLNVLLEGRKFAACKYNKKNELMRPIGSECFVVPLHPITCTSDFDLALMGHRSGSLAARFNHFFLEPLGADKFVPGFGKSSEDLFGANVFAFALEYALPDVVKDLTNHAKSTLVALRQSVQFQLNEVVGAIRKMRNYLPKYYNELLMDQAELRTRPTSQNLEKIFNNIVKLFNTIEEKVSGLSGTTSSDISFRYRQDMARCLITGIIDNTGKTGLIANSLVEHAMAIIFGAEVYHTTGTVRHVFGSMKLGKTTLPLHIVDVWVSMLENWADTVKEFKRECERHALLVAQCFPKISKNLFRGLKAMEKVREILPAQVEGNSAFKSDLADVKGAAAIVGNWYYNVKRKVSQFIKTSIEDIGPTLSKIVGCNILCPFDQHVG